MSTTTTNLATSFITFTRTSNATVTDSNGFIKWAGHNLLTNSESFDASAWAKSAATVSANATIAPNGSTNADTVLDTAVSNIHYISQSLTSFSPSGLTLTVSAFCKAATLNYATIGVSDISSGSLYAVAVFNLSSGSIATSGALGIGYSVVGTPTIAAVGSGWYLCSVTVTVGSSASFLNAVIGVNKTGVITASAGGFESYLGNGSGIHVWGAHVFRSDLGGMVLNPARGDAYYPTTPRNLLGFTESLTTGWTNSNTTDSIVTETNPNGLASSVEVTATAGNGTLLGSLSLLASPYTFSIWLKRKTGTGTVEITVDGTTYVAAAVTGTWTRFSTTLTPTAGTKTPGIRLVTSGDAVFAWGAQLSDSASLDAYSPVYGAAVTSAAYYAPRLDFDPVTLAARGLLVEEQRTNLLQWSSDFRNTTDAGSSRPWIYNNVTVTPNDAVAPDGTMTADRINPSSNAAIYYQLASPASATTWTFSIWLRSATGSSFTMPYYVNGSGANPTPQTGTLGTVTTQWQRFSVQVTTASSAATVNIALGNYSTGWVSGNNVHAWGAQIDSVTGGNATFPTSYIPTNGAQATRTADVASVSTQAFPYSATEGTLVAKGTFIAPADAGVSVMANLDNGSSGESINIYRQSNLVYLNIFDNSGPAQAQWAVSGTTNLSTAAIAYKLNDIGAAVNGSSQTPDTSATLPTVDRMNIGRMWGGTFGANGHIRQITYIPRRLSSSELQARTV